MSLITLTFGSKKPSAKPQDYTKVSQIDISTPMERHIMRQKLANGLKGKAEIKRACRFYAQENVYVVAQVTEGILCNEMKAFYGDKELELLQLESKYGDKARKGNVVGLTLKGINEWELEKGGVLNFRSA